MSSKFKRWMYSMLIIGVTLNLGIFIQVEFSKYNARRVFQKVNHNDKLYVYETYFGALNAVMYVNDTKDTLALIRYYEKLARKDSVAVINFGLNFMPISMHQPMYVYSYISKGSKVVEMVDFNFSCWGYIKGYVYKGTTHNHAAADSLIKAKESFINNFKEDINMKIKDNVSKKISPYGWYCDD